MWDATTWGCRCWPNRSRSSGAGVQRRSDGSLNGSGIRSGTVPGRLCRRRSTGRQRPAVRATDHADVLPSNKHISRAAPLDDPGRGCRALRAGLPRGQQERLARQRPQRLDLHCMDHRHRRRPAERAAVTLPATSRHHANAWINADRGCASSNRRGRSSTDDVRGQSPRILDINNA